MRNIKCATANPERERRALRQTRAAYAPGSRKAVVANAMLRTIDADGTDEYGWNGFRVLDVYTPVSSRAVVVRRSSVFKKRVLKQLLRSTAREHLKVVSGNRLRKFGRVVYQSVSLL